MVFIGCPLTSTGGRPTRTVCAIWKKPFPSLLECRGVWQIMILQTSNHHSEIHQNFHFSLTLQMNQRVSSTAQLLTEIHLNQFHFVLLFSFYTIWRYQSFFNTLSVVTFNRKEVYVRDLMKLINSIWITAIVYSGIQISHSSIHVSQLFCSRLLKLSRFVTLLLGKT